MSPSIPPLPTSSSSVTRGLAGLLAALTLTGPAQLARAAPPAGDEEQEVACEVTLPEARLIVGRDLYARADELFKQEDYLGALEAWEQMLQLMPEKEDELRVQIAHAHHRAYAVDNDSDHLRSAQALFDARLASLEPDDTTRADIEAELADIEAQLDAVAEAEAKALAEREEAIRQEQIRLNEQALAEEEAKHQRNIQKIYYGVGGSVSGLGLGSLAAMTAFLVSGAKLDREGQATANSTGVADGYYQEQLSRGVAQNRTAVVTGVIGGVLVAAGGSLLVLAAVRHKRVIGPHENKVVVYPTIGGVQLRF